MNVFQQFTFRVFGSFREQKASTINVVFTSFGDGTRVKKKNMISYIFLSIDQRWTGGVEKQAEV